jgi:hypothetical protein
MRGYKRELATGSGNKRGGRGAVPAPIGCVPFGQPKADRCQPHANLHVFGRPLFFTFGHLVFVLCPCCLLFDILVSGWNFCNQFTLVLESSGSILSRSSLLRIDVKIQVNWAAGSAIPAQQPLMTSGAGLTLLISVIRVWVDLAYFCHQSLG